jgi:hypothetical protein
MAFFALFFLTDAGIAYINATRAMVAARLRNLYQALELPIESDPANTGYYAMIDLLDVAQARHGAGFARHLSLNVDPWP